MPPVVPRYDERQIAPQPIRTPYQSGSSSPADFGAGVGAAVQGAGQQLAQASDALGKSLVLQAIEDNEAGAKNADVEFNKALRTRMLDPSKGFFAKRGKDAMDAYTPTMEEITEMQRRAVEALPNREQQRLFRDVSQRRIDATLDSMMRHATAERRGYLDATNEARVVDATNNASAYYRDAKTIAQSIAMVRNEVLDMGQRNGWSEEMIKVEIAKRTSAVHVGVIGKMAVDDPEGAKLYFDANRDRIDGGTHSAIERSLKEGLDRRAVLGAVDAARGDNIPSTYDAEFIAAEREGGAPADFTKRIAWRESRFRQDIAAGKTHSPKGAKGLMQFMDGTRSGYPHDPSDAKASIRAGSKHLADLLKQYGGDQELAAIAYNAGPGVADAYVKAGRDKSMLPKETQGYIAEVIGGGSGQRQAPALKEQLDYIDSLGMSPERTAAARSQAITRQNQDEAAKNAGERASRDALWATAMAPNVRSVEDLRRIPDMAEHWAAATPEAQRSIMLWFEHKAKGKDNPANPEAYTELSRMMVEDAERFRDLDLGPYALRLPHAEWRHFQDQQTVMNRREVRDAEREVNMQRAFSLSRQSLQAAGFKLGEKAPDKDKKAVAEFNYQLERRIDAYRVENKKRPGDKELLQMIDGLLIEGRVRGTGWVWDDKVKSFQAPPGKEFYVPYGDIPKDRRGTMERMLKEKGLPSAEADVERAYTQWRMQGNR